jgi:hypothetical protein
MKLTIFMILAACLPLAAQVQLENDWCSDRGWHSDNMVQHSEVREEHLAATAETMIDPAQNGSIHVQGWANSDILVKACVRASAEDMGTAQALAKQVTVTDGPGRVVAKGPANTGGHAGWSVSYEVWVPAAANLQLKAFNGSIHLEGTTGQIRAHTLNGSLHLKDVGGDVEAETQNGSLTLELASSGWHGKGLKLNTTNGSVRLNLPATFSAEVEASTVNGRVKSDFPTGEDESDRNHQRHNLAFTIGAGGPKIEARTVNGSVQISRQS